MAEAGLTQSQGKGVPADTATLPNNTVTSHAGTVPKPVMPHAFKRLLKPTMSDTSPVSGDLSSTSYLNLPDTIVNAPVPVLVKHGARRLPEGKVEGDHHSKNTNPGFIRNPMGGFYTS
eukprot:gnl/MRDRNA2_/MRDRNA2_73735_c0_seq1.p1 gnl/MRDRNA2_/MRDRNA2_73735_c0~~gnl/MRDRNA2_/MRDRNA2_73735_c0_seq1.p1  ORF type:complete len:118 (+),score=10.34 gnl/MRDRNA2_/MRDRNA2_73735_c0_seq1:78-431(+)